MENDKNKNPHAGHRKRMRERYAQSGFAGWADHEVLEFILFDKIPRKDTNKLAHDIIAKFGSIENVLKADPEKLQQIKGIGPKTAQYIHTQEKIYSFCTNRKKSDGRAFYDKKHPEEYLSGLFRNKSNEGLYMICLDGHDRIIRCYPAFEGNFESVNLNVGSMVRMAVACEAQKIVLAHNHPSGILDPSDSDITATEVIISVMQVVGVEVADHFIVTENGCRSMMNKISSRRIK